MSFTLSRARVKAIGIAAVALLTLASALFIGARGALAGHPQAAKAAPPPVLSAGSRDDSVTLTAQHLSAVDAAQVAQGTPYSGPAHNVNRRLPARSNVKHNSAPAPTGPATSLNVSPNAPTPLGTFQGQAQTNLVPSDMGLAAGGGYIVQAVNASIAVYNTNGALQSGWPKTPQSLFGLSSSEFMYDPRVLFDSISGHFFVLFDDDNDTAGHLSSTYYLAVSATANPTGTWYRYAFSVGENLTNANAAFADFPIAGIDAQGFYFSGNRFYFTANGGGFADSFVASTGLAALEKNLTTQINYTIFNNLTTATGKAFSVAPATSFGYPRAEPLISTDLAGCTTDPCTTYYVWAISYPTNTTAPGPRLSWVQITGPAYSLNIPLADQPGTGGAGSIDSGDARVASLPSFRANSLYFTIGTAINNGTQTVAAVEWANLAIVLDTGNAACGAVPNRCVDITSAYAKEYGSVWYNGSTHAFDPSVAITSDGDMVMAYSVSSLTTRPVTIIFARRSTSNLGDTQIVPGSQSLAFWSFGRWGDYSAVALDSTTCSSAGCFRLWDSAMYVRSNGTWGTTISSELYNVLIP